MIDSTKIGMLIRYLRIEKNMTQKQLADKMRLSDKTISKWERGIGLPDISYLSELSEILNVNIEEMLKGELTPSNFEGGNMKKSKYFVCPTCKNLTICTGDSQISCCGRKLEPLKLEKAPEDKKLIVGELQDNWHITSNNPMTKDNYISFVALVSSTEIDIIKQYPEWALTVEFNKNKRGMLIWYCANDGLLYQMLNKR